MKPITLIFYFLLFSATTTLGQNIGHLNNKRCKWVKWQEFPFELDTFSVAASSLEIADIIPRSISLQNIKIKHDINTNKIKFQKLNNTIAVDSVLICYRVFPFNFSEPFFSENPIIYDTSYYQEVYRDAEPIFQPKVIREEIFNTDGISKTGSLTRGISFGNAQDVFVNSALNLQLDGQLSNDISITAAISDQNIPFQPEGNTQQLQDFDKVYIKFKHKKGSLLAGDIVLKNDSSSYFLKHKKNVQGVLFKANFGKDAENNSATKVGFAVAKGQFFSLQLETQEGVLGAYRLQAGKEKFITIMANSERVFLDGKPLKRGYDADYIINYNTAEITFTNRIVITKFSRVRIDFEYASQNFSRSIIAASHSQKLGKFTVGMHFYREKDNQNNPILANLNDEGIRILAAAGDQLENAAYQKIDTLSVFDVDRILYTSKDTIVGGISYTIFVRATPESTLFLSLGFSEIGQGKGNYRISGTTTNGRLYQWIAPQNQIPQGNYAPTIPLAAPNKRQLISFQTKYQLSKSEQITAEIAFSDYDKNLFSTIDNQDNKSFATKIGYHNKGKDFNLLKDYKWEASLSLEFDKKHFSPIDRFRKVDFDRNWSINQDSAADDLILSSKIGIKKGNESRWNYQFSKRERGENNGFQHKITIKEKLGVFRLNSQLFLMHNSQDSTVSDWQKLLVGISLPKPKIVYGYQYSEDKNTVSLTANDSIFRTAMNFQQHKIYLKSGKKKGFKFHLDYSFREDKTPFEGNLVKGNSAQMFNFSLQRKKKQNHFNLFFTYRKIETFNNLKPTSTPETIMGRIDWKSSFLKNAIQSSLNFNTATGRERKREFIFLKVATGLGTHTWRDDNSDGVQDLSEFYLAINADEKNYAKFFVPTAEFVQAFSAAFNYRLRLKAPRSWRKAKGWKHLASKFSAISSMIINTKTTENRLQQRFLPFLFSLSDSNLLVNNSSIKSTFFYNRRSPKFGGEFQFSNINNKQLLNNGFDNLKNKSYQFIFRWNVNRIFNIKTKFIQSQKENISDIFKNRNYKIFEQGIQPIFAFQPNKNIRLTAAYFYKSKKNISETIENSALKNVQFEELEFRLRWAKSGKRSVNFSFKTINIRFKGSFSAESINSPIGYQLLEGLREGTNFNWKIVWTQRLTNGLQLNFNYTARKSEQQAIIHLGRMQITALF